MPTCPRCNAYVDGVVWEMHKRYCANCGCNVDSPTEPSIDWARRRQVQRIAERIDQVDPPLKVPPGTTARAWQGLGAQRVANGWRIPERDVGGSVTAWVLRTDLGRKLTEAGGKRGLIFRPPLPERAGTDPADPILLTDGASETAAAASLSFDVIGRGMSLMPAAVLDGLAGLVQGRHVTIVEDAAGAGRDGAEAMASVLMPVCESVRRVVPPSGFRDLRCWVAAGDATRRDVADWIAAATPRAGVQLELPRGGGRA